MDVAIKCIGRAGQLREGIVEIQQLTADSPAKSFSVQTACYRQTATCQKQELLVRCCYTTPYRCCTSRLVETLLNDWAQQERPIVALAHADGMQLGWQVRSNFSQDFLRTWEAFEAVVPVSKS